MFGWKKKQPEVVIYLDDGKTCYNCWVKRKINVQMKYIDQHKWFQCPDCNLVSTVKTDEPLYWTDCPSCKNRNVTTKDFVSGKTSHICTHCGKEIRS